MKKLLEKADEQTAPPAAMESTPPVPMTMFEKRRIAAAEKKEAKQKASEKMVENMVEKSVLEPTTL